MTRNLHTALGVVATVGLALAASAAIAHSPGAGGGAPGGMGEHGAMSGAMHGGMGGSMQGMHAMHEKMASAKTPQERQALAAGMRAEMEKRAEEPGIAMPEHGAAQGRMGMQQGSGHRH